MENKVRIIDKNALMDDSTTTYINGDGYIALWRVDEFPEIDPESLRPKGRWVMKETMIRSPFAKNAYCSECLEETCYAYNYCPNCGAKMEG